MMNLNIVECCKSNDSFVQFVSTSSKGRNFTKNSFDIVAKRQNVEATFDFVAFDNVASTLLLVWTAGVCY